MVSTSLQLFTSYRTPFCVSKATLAIPFPRSDSQYLDNTQVVTVKGCDTVFVAFVVAVFVDGFADVVIV